MKLQKFVREYLDPNLDVKSGKKLHHEYHEKLIPDLWEDKRLKKSVEKQIKQIADRFLKALDLPEMVIVDITLTGSIANYNWTKLSDVDIHIVADVAQRSKKYGKITPKYIETKTDLWNKKHNIKIYDHDVELYVQDEAEPHDSTGVYSVKEQEWVNEPTYDKPEINVGAVLQKLKQLTKEIKQISQDEEAKPEDVDQLKDKIRKYRKAGLQKNGEYSVENLVFKELRYRGYLGLLSDTKQEIIDTELSIDDEEQGVPWWEED